MTWTTLRILVVGDRAEVETDLAELGMPVRLVDHDGRLLEWAAGAG